MKFWFYDFIEELSESLSKVWGNYKRKKDPNYKETEKLKKRIRIGLRIFLVLALALAIFYLCVRIVTTFQQ